MYSSNELTNTSPTTTMDSRRQLARLQSPARLATVQHQGTLSNPRLRTELEVELVKLNKTLVQLKEDSHAVYDLSLEMHEKELGVTKEIRQRQDRISHFKNLIREEEVIIEQKATELGTYVRTKTINLDKVNECNDEISKVKKRIIDVQGQLEVLGKGAYSEPDWENSPISVLRDDVEQYTRSNSKSGSLSDGTPFMAVALLKLTKSQLRGLWERMSHGHFALNNDFIATSTEEFRKTIVSPRLDRIGQLKGFDDNTKLELACLIAKALKIPDGDEDSD